MTSEQVVARLKCMQWSHLSDATLDVVDVNFDVILKNTENDGQNYYEPKILTECLEQLGMIVVREIGC